MLLVTIGCSNAAQMSDFKLTDSQDLKGVANTERQTLQTPCGFDLRERIETFYSSVPDDFRDADADSKFMADLKSCPRKKTLDALLALRDAEQKISAQKLKLPICLSNSNIIKARTGKSCCRLTPIGAKNFLNAVKKPTIQPTLITIRLFTDMANTYWI